MTKFYDWEKTLAYDADVTMVIGARGIGKTFGLRRQCIKDFIKQGVRFVEVTRYKNELSGVSDGYFNRLERLEDFEGYIFKTDARYAYIAKKAKDDSEKINWKLIGYFIALSDAQRMKKRTFDKVKRIIFDEAILERSDRYHRYLQNEFGVFANLIDTVSRERADTKSIRPRVYLLGNACDLANPYFAAYKVSTDLDFGYRWYNKKTFLLHYVDAGSYADEKLTGTVAGRMIANTAEGRVAAKNEFVGYTKEFVMKKPSRAKYQYAIIINGCTYGIWLDLQGGRYHITSKIPNNSDGIYYLTSEDASVNWIAANKSTPLIRVMGEAYYLGMLRYESVEVKAGFMRVLALFGIM